MSQTVLSERYQLIKPIGKGGMATVYQAKDQILDRIVAVKIMNPALTHNQEFIERFTWEARATGSLSHSNIVNIYDVGVDQQTYFMVMEYVEGITLKERIAQKGIIPIEEAISIASQICDALAHAHKNGIIHRDIKPQNIMCSANGQYQLADFGISRFTKSDSNLTKTGTIMGSVHYFSPEQAQGKKTGITTDLYALGVVLYEMLTGQPPYDAPEQLAIALMHIQQPIPNPQKLIPSLPNSLCKLIMKAMSKEAKDRFQSAIEMKEALESIDGSRQSKQIPIKKDTSRPSQKPLAETTNRKRSKMIWTFATAVFVVLVTLFGYPYAEATFFSKKEPSDQLEVNNVLPSDTESEQTDDDEKKISTSEPLKEEEINQDEIHKELLKKNAPTNKGEYVILMGSFKEKENAERLLKKLNQEGFQSHVKKSIVFGDTMYRVLSQEFISRAEAEQYLTHILQSGIEGTKDAMIIPLETKKK